jgi:DNA-binding response OmpR family regulator
MSRILVVDDDEDVRSIIKDMLVEEGFSVDVAEDGDTATKKFENDPYDLVITDIIMPGKEGITTIKDVKKIKPDVKIIAISGGGFAGPLFYLETAEGFGANESLAKPIEKKLLLKTVRNLLK